MLYEEEHPFAIAYRLVEEGKLDPWNRALSAAVFLLKKQVEVLFPEPKKKRERKYTLEEIVQMFEEESGESAQQENQTIHKWNCGGTDKNHKKKVTGLQEGSEEKREKNTHTCIKV
jgi:segregation and condensation protein A